MSCPFCARIDNREYDGRDSELDVVWFEPLNPVTPGHLLFVPMEHIEHGSGRNVPVGEAFEAASRFANNQSIKDFNLITSSGAAATQTVPHVHVHLVPRRGEDGLQLPWGLPKKEAWKPGDPCGVCGSRNTGWDFESGGYCGDCGAMDSDE